MDEISELDDVFFQKVQGIFKKKLGIEHDISFQRVWEQALATYQIQWTKSDPLTVETFHQLEKALHHTLVYFGEGIELEVSEPCSQVGEMVRYLLGRGTFSIEWLNWKNIKGVLFKKDPELLREMRKEFKHVLRACTHQFPAENSREEFVYQTFIGNVIALLPYSYPEEGEEFIIPQKVAGKWRSCRYVVDRKIELMEACFASPLIHYGLTSIDGPPLLSFLGTTYPAGDGFIASLFSSCMPGLSIGQAPYLMGKENIAQWLEGKEGVRLFGISLGSALAFHTLRDHKEKIDRIDAYSPAGLYSWNWKEEYDSSPEINIYYQYNDVVPNLGIFPTGRKVSVYRLIPDMPDNFLNAHFRVYSAANNVQILKSSSEYENSRFYRGILTGLHLISGVFPFLPLLSLHLMHLVLVSLSRPLYDMWDEKLS